MTLSSLRFSATDAEDKHSELREGFVSRRDINKWKSALNLRPTSGCNGPRDRRGWESRRKFDVIDDGTVSSGILASVERKTMKRKLEVVCNARYAIHQASTRAHTNKSCRYSGPYPAGWRLRDSNQTTTASRSVKQPRPAQTRRLPAD